MAQAAVAPLSQQANGVGIPSNLAPVVVPVKRKWSTSDAMDLDGDEAEADSLAVKAPRTNTAGVRDYFDVLASIDVTPSVLKRRLSHSDSIGEPQPKLQKTGDAALSISTSITTKVDRNEYDHVEDVAKDVVAAADAQISSLRNSISRDDSHLPDEVAIVATEKFKRSALDLLRREQSYPHNSHNSHISHTLHNLHTSQASSGDDGDMVLSIWANVPQPRQLYSSLAVRSTKLEDIAAANVALATRRLPPGISLARVAFTPSTKNRRIPTLGELFAPQRRQPPLQPPRPTSQPKGNVLNFQTSDPDFHRPPKNSSSYYYAKLAVGHYLDYGNAAPTAPQAKSLRQRERAQSLAGVRPSIDGLEQSEMDAIFRRAFSSFAPTRDDSNAVVPASVAARHWWRRSGRRSFARLIHADEHVPSLLADEQAVEDEPDAMELQETATALDDAAIRQVIDSWDDDLVDPSLGQVLGAAKSTEEKDVDEKLQDITNLIETLSSYQHIRNLVLPTSQTRAAGAPVEIDMLAHGSEPVPSDEEAAVYHRLKKDLADVIATLPPYAVAKLGGDKLGDLVVNSDIEIRTEHHFGLLEDEETPQQAQARLRQQQQQQQPVPPASRTPGGQRTAASPAVSNQSRPYPQSRTPVPPPHQFHHRPAPSLQHHSVTAPMPPQQQTRPVAGAGRAAATPPYRPPNGYHPPYPQQQMPRPGQPFHQQPQQPQPQPQPQQQMSMPMPSGYPGQQPPPHLQQRPSFNGMQQQHPVATPPNARFSPAFPPAYTQNSPSPSGHGPHSGLHPQYQNGMAPGGVPGRTASAQTRVPQAAVPYSSQPQNSNQTRLPPAQGQGGQTNRPSSHHNPPMPSQPSLTSGFHHSMTPEQNRKTADNARRRADEWIRTHNPTGQSFDYNAMQTLGHKSPSPVAAMAQGYPGVNGQQNQQHKQPQQQPPQQTSQALPIPGPLKIVTPVPPPPYASRQNDYQPRPPMTPQAQPPEKPRPQQGQAA